MNDEQQLWRDVQKFMNQFPGFVAVAKKIGEIGDLGTWQAAEKRKLEALTQEVEKQRQLITSERAAANTEAARKKTEMDAEIVSHQEWAKNHKDAATTTAQSVVAEAKASAEKVLNDARAKAAEITKVVEPKKAALKSRLFPGSTAASRTP